MSKITRSEDKLYRGVKSLLRAFQKIEAGNSILLTPKIRKGWTDYFEKLIADYEGRKK